MCAACVEMVGKSLEEQLQILGRYMQAKQSKEMQIHLQGALDNLMQKDENGEDSELAAEWERVRRE